MIRFLLRFAGLCCFAAACVALIVDVRRSYSSGLISVTSFGESFKALPPGHFIPLREFIERHFDPLTGDLAALHLFDVPVWLLLGVLGMLANTLGSRPAEKFGILSR